MRPHAGGFEDQGADRRDHGAWSRFRAGAGRLISAQLYGVSFWDPLALGLAMLSLAGCAFVAAVVPASRAAAVSPTSALRAE